MSDILILSLEKRKNSALKVQKILTESGCFIKTRIGLHGDGCNDRGLIILELSAPAKEIKAVASKLAKAGGVKTKLVKI
ncbi:MAG: hypothetical protein FWC57_02925 [Endomicrobia bacterium]|nr:hypothetical protein [Endomicrobiia bacterium]